MNASTTSTDVLVVGGGMAGLAGALAMRATGARVTLLEKAPEFGEVGAGLQMAPNACRVLDSWGLLDQVRAVGFEPDHLVFRDALSGAELTRQGLGPAFRERYGAPYVVIHRSDLHAILLQACRSAGVELVTNVHIDRVETDGEWARATAADGARHTARLVLGADGLGSTLRGALVADEPIVSEYVAYRGTVPISADTPSGDLTDVVVYLGPECHLVQYPLRRGALLNSVAVYRSKSFAAGREQVEDGAELRAAYAHCAPAVQESLVNLGTGHRWPMYDRDPTTDWVDGRLLLIGDAAHPMLQYLAQGACQAIEDAAFLQEVMGGVDLADTAALDSALLRFVAERAPRTARVQRTARAWGEAWHVTGIGRTLRNMLFAARSDGDLEVADWLYDRPGRRPTAPDQPGDPRSSS